MEDNNNYDFVNGDVGKDETMPNTRITQSPSVWWAGAVFKVTRAFGQVQGGLPQEY